MFDTEDARSILTWTDENLANHIPGAEDDRHEFKSSQTSDGDLKRKIAQAGSAFWNSGGGVFVAGVDGAGVPDGGIARIVGRQPRRDWIDQALADIEPKGTYAVVEISDTNRGLNIGPDRAIFAIGFAASEALPHMAPDNKYYIRAGAHTLAASHFLVEALRSRRGLTRPILRPTFRVKPQRSSVLQLGIIALNDAPAVDVEITFEPLPPMFARVDEARLPIRASVIDQRNAFYFDYAFMYSEQYGIGNAAVTLIIQYKDLFARDYELRVTLDPLREVGPRQAGTPPDEKIEQHLDRIQREVTRAASALQDLAKLEKHASQSSAALKDLSRKVK